MLELLSSRDEKEPMMFQFRQESKQASTVEELCDGVRSIKLILCHFCAATDNREDQARERSDQDR